MLRGALVALVMVGSVTGALAAQSKADSAKMGRSRADSTKAGSAATRSSRAGEVSCSRWTGLRPFRPHRSGSIRRKSAFPPGVQAHR